MKKWLTFKVKGFPKIKSFWNRIAFSWKSAFLKLILWALYWFLYMEALTDENGLILRLIHFSKVSQFWSKQLTDKLLSLNNKQCFKCKLFSLNMRKKVKYWNQSSSDSLIHVHRQKWCRLTTLPSISTYIKNKQM